MVDYFVSDRMDGVLDIRSCMHGPCQKLHCITAHKTEGQFVDWLRTVKSEQEDNERVSQGQV